ncbi:MAG: 4Fe-4S binding protein [Nevskia sp.]|nr:4Fe-4S binding protein [Nevskia sp.]
MDAHAAAPGSPQPPGGEVFLYQHAAKIQPRYVWGRFARLRVAAMLVLLALYYVTPWLSWGGRPLVLFDLPHRRFHVLNLTLVPQDLLLLACLLLLAALTLFLFTSLAGRLWCGYACPQTVWTEAFLWIEHFCEGDRHARMKLDGAPWNRRKLLRRGGKHLLWAAFGLLTGLSFVAYFVPARELFPAALSFQLGGWPLFWSLFYGVATWGNAGFMREQVCKYMCPYARFQSAMFDRDTLIISYDEQRAEPRKGRVRRMARAATVPAGASTTATGAESSVAVLSAGGTAAMYATGPAPASPPPAKPGDCVDCSLCVQVCPVGIDIRKGLQYECIACAACIDACDSVMAAVGKPRGLIRYSSSQHDRGGKFRLLRGRTIGYGLVWLAACAAFVMLLLTHSTLRVDVLRDRHTLYRELPTGAIENLYTIKVTNDDERTHRYHVSAHFADGTPLAVEPSILERKPEETGGTTVSLRTPPRAENAPALPMIEDVEVEVDEEHDEDEKDEPQVSRTRSARFITGAKR